MQCLCDSIERIERSFPPRLASPAFAAPLMLLACFRAEFTQLLIDSEAVARSIVARAFAHLQRSIIADEAVKSRWKKGFSEGELACERLGACHLLAHGIWAFKTSAAGERTDLVLNEPLADLEGAQRASAALALTEWKVVKCEAESDAKASQALYQARLYSASILAGSELSSRRYLVMVSEARLQPRAHHRDGSLTYEYVNIAVSPDVPSKRPRRGARPHQSSHSMVRVKTGGVPERLLDGAGK